MQTASEFIKESPVHPAELVAATVRCLAAGWALRQASEENTDARAVVSEMVRKLSPNTVIRVLPDTLLVIGDDEEWNFRTIAADLIPSEPTDLDGTDTPSAFEMDRTSAVVEGP